MVLTDLPGVLVDGVVAELSERHDLRVVGFALAVAALASLTTVNMLARPLMARQPPTFLRGYGLWLPFAAIVFGAGIWSAHFIALLAWRPGVATAYSLPETELSLLVGIVGSLFAFALARPGRGTLADTLIGGTVLGISIYAMHFIGMAALRLCGTLEFATGLRTTALIVGIICATLGLARARTYQRLWARSLSALLLAGAIVGTHFNAMSATSVIAEDGAAFRTGPDSGPVAVAVALVSVALLVLTLVVMILDSRRLARQRETRRLRQLADGTFEGIFIHRDGVLLEVNQALCALLGRRPEALIGTHLLDHVPPGAAGLVRERLASGACDPVEVEVQTAEGPRLVEVLTRQVDYEGRTAWMSAVRDLSERKAAEERIRYLAHHDGLTGLANRALLQDRLTQALAIADRHAGGLAVLCLDLDRFKLVNDLMGHEAGDRLLGQVAIRLRGCVRTVDTIARTGGDEFVIVQPGGGQPLAAEMLASRLIALLAAPYEIDGQQVNIGTSVGIAVFPHDGDRAGDLLKRADIALYRSKADGRGTYRFYEPEMNAQLLARRTLEQDLRAAIGTDALSLRYQPLFDCATGAVTGCEALLRWHHPTRGEVPAGEFIQIAEETGLIAPLGLWVLETCCRQARHWPAGVRIAANLSPAQLRGGDLVERVAEVLAETGLPAARLELEVTEGLLIDEPDRALDMLRRLKDLGVRLALDDFGTGYASLSSLHRYPFDKIKIDRSFVSGLCADAQAAIIVHAIIGLGRSLDLSVTAEGVETEGQLAALRADGCGEVQGNLLARPLRADALEALFASGVPVAAPMAGPLAAPVGAPVGALAGAMEPVPVDATPAAVAAEQEPAAAL